MQDIQVSTLGQEDPQEKKMAAHSSILAWESLRTEEPGGLQSITLQRVGHDLVAECAPCTHTHTHTDTYGILPRTNTIL